MKVLLLPSPTFHRPPDDAVAEAAAGARWLANVAWLGGSDFGGSDTDELRVALPQSLLAALAPLVEETAPHARIVPLAGHLGAAAALREAWRGTAPDGPVAVVDAVEPLAFDLGRLATEHARSPALATIACRTLRRDEFRQADARLLEVDRAGRVVRIVRAAVDASPDRAPVGVTVIEPELFARIPSGSPEFGIVEDLLPQALRHGVILGAFDVGWPAFGPEPSAEAWRRGVATRS